MMDLIPYALIILALIAIGIPLGFTIWLEKEAKHSTLTDSKDKDRIGDEEENEEEAKTKSKAPSNIETIDTLKKCFEAMGKNCPSINITMLGARSQLDRLDGIKAAFSELEQIAYNKGIINKLRESLNVTSACVFQNARDIKTILIGAQPRWNNPLSKESESEIRRELDSNNRILMKFRRLFEEAARHSTQQEDAFTDLDIDATRTAISNYFSIKNQSSHKNTNKTAL
jgi:hypothetical protein